MTKKKKRNAKTTKHLKSGLRKDVLHALGKNPGRALNYKQVAKIMKTSSATERKLIVSILHELKTEGKVREEARGKYQIKQDRTTMQGRIELTTSGSAFVVCDDLKDDIFIPPRNVHQALNGDLVEVSVFAQQRGRSMEGEITAVVERARSEFVGKLNIKPKFAFLIPDSRKMNVDIFIPLDKLNGAKDGEKVIVRMTDWPERYDNPFGEVINVLGAPGDNNVEIHAILAEFGLPYEFPEKVEEAADKIPFAIPEEEIARRKDFRKITTFTIDPVDAKDFDDALSINYLKNGNIEIGVHIADVSHYVKQKSVLDQEAITRGNSVYLVDRVVPMLPEALSNGVCSLRPNEDKLCFSAVFELTKSAAVVGEWFGKTVIHSDKRFAYEDAQELIEGADGEFKNEVLALNKLAKTMRSRRMKAGALEIGSKEVRFEIDDQGNPLSTYIKESKDANKLIEEFMLLANKKVAERIGKIKEGTPVKPFMYRIHDKPDPEKLLLLAQMVEVFGYDFHVANGIANPEDIRRLIKEIQGKPEGHIIETMIIRSMSKAIYTTENVGHFGLAFSHYTHFTSPIRRYPDLEVHRLLAQYLEGKGPKGAKKLEVIAKHCSITERKASEAERQSIKFKQVQFMTKHLGEEFWGVVSGITKWGIYVELVDNFCEGMVHVSNLGNDRYNFDETKYQMVGQRTKTTIKLGDKMKVQVVSADVQLRQLDFDFLELGEEEVV